MRANSEVGSGNAERGSPLKLVRALYRKHGLDFQADLEDHLRYGFVVALPICFAMATAIKLDGREVDAWFVKVAAGDLQLLVRLIPVPLPFIAFSRWKNESIGPMKVYRRAAFLAHANNLSDFPLPPSAFPLPK